MKKLRLPPNVMPLGHGKRLLGSLLDAVFTIAFMSLIYALVGRPLIQKGIGYDETLEARTSFVESPGLMNKISSSEYRYFDFKDYDNNTDTYGYAKYETMVWEYFTVFLPSHPEYTYSPDGFGKTQGNKLIPFEESYLSDPAKIGRWTYENFFMSDFYVAKEVDGKPDYTSRPVLSAMASEKEDGKLKYAHGLRDFFKSYEKTEKGAYIEAAIHLIKQPKIAEYDAALSQKQWISFLPSLIAGPLIFFYLIPVLMPNGKSLGKLIVGGGVLNDEGFTATRQQIVVRSILPTAIWFILLVPWIYVGILGFLFSVAIMYMFVAMSPSGQGLYDRLAKTVVINARKSIWFPSREEQEEYIEHHPRSLIARQARKEDPNPPKIATKEDYGVLDSSMIGQARKTAQTIESFDEFESREEKRPENPAELKPREEPKEEPPMEQKEDSTTLENEEERFTDDPK